MIGIILAVAQANVMVTEVPDPSAGRLVVQIVAGLDNPDRREWAASHAVRESLFDGTIGFTSMDLLTYATLGGDAFRITLAPDHLRIGYSVPAGDVKLAARIADDLVRDALLSESSVKTALDEIPFRKRAPWSEVWNPISTDASSVTRTDVVRQYRKIFRPENVSIAIGGAVVAGQGRREFGDRFASWKTVPPAGRTVRDRPPASIEHRSARLTTVRLEGSGVRLLPTVGGNSEAAPNLGAALLACSILGQGKGSTLFQVLRENLGLSYRQEAFLAPSMDGLRPVVAFASASPRASEADIRSPLLRAIADWTEADRGRALALAKSDVELDLGLGTLCFAEERPLSGSLVDRTFLVAYWRLKTGRTWNWPTALAEMDAVPLEEVKTYAKAWIENGRVAVITPR